MYLSISFVLTVIYTYHVQVTFTPHKKKYFQKFNYLIATKKLQSKSGMLPIVLFADFNYPEYHHHITKFFGPLFNSLPTVVGMSSGTLSLKFSLTFSVIIFSYLAPTPDLLMCAAAGAQALANVVTQLLVYVR